MSASSSKERNHEPFSSHDDTNVPNFLKKTFEILENKTYSNIIAWHNDGKAIVIKDTSELADKILPIFFKHRNFTSYVRQLNLYGFKKLKSSANQQVYYHPMFQKGKRELLSRIKRKNAENLLVFKRRASDSGMSESEHRASEHGERPDLADFEQLQFNERVDDSSVAIENNLLKKVHKDINHRINMLELQFKQLADQNKYLVGVITKRDLELDSLIQSRLIGQRGTPLTSASEFNHTRSPPESQAEYSRKSSDSQQGNGNPTQGASNNSNNITSSQPNVIPMPVAMYQNQLQGQTSQIPQHGAFSKSFTPIFDKSTAAASSNLGSLGNNIGNIQSLINYYSNNRGMETLMGGSNMGQQMQPDLAQLQSTLQAISNHEGLNSEGLPKIAYAQAPMSLLNNMCVIGFMPQNMLSAGGINPQAQSTTRTRNEEDGQVKSEQ